MSRPRCLAVMYHYVRQCHGEHARDIPGLDARTFNAQLDNLCNALTPIDWPTLVAGRAGNAVIPDDSFLLTFDDGLAGHAEVVLPILARRGLRGVFFVSTRVLVETTMEPAHQIHLLMARLGAPALSDAVREWLDGHAPGGASAYAVDPLAARTLYHYETPPRAELKHLLVRILPVDLRDRLVSELFATHLGEVRQHARRWYMQWDQLIELQRAGHTIGGHGHDHVPRDRMSPPDQVRDLARCAAVLREGLGIGHRPFSYPYGSCDHEIARRCALAGFVNGFTTRPGWIVASDDDHQLGRVDTIHVDEFLEREFQCIQA